MAKARALAFVFLAAATLWHGEGIVIRRGPAVPVAGSAAGSAQAAGAGAGADAGASAAGASGTTAPPPSGVPKETPVGKNEVPKPDYPFLTGHKKLCGDHDKYAPPYDYKNSTTCNPCQMTWELTPLGRSMCDRIASWCATIRAPGDKPGTSRAGEWANGRVLREALARCADFDLHGRHRNKFMTDNFKLALDPCLLRGDALCQSLGACPTAPAWIDAVPNFPTLCYTNHGSTNSVPSLRGQFSERGILTSEKDVSSRIKCETSDPACGTQNGNTDTKPFVRYDRSDQFAADGPGDGGKGDYGGGEIDH